MLFLEVTEIIELEQRAHVRYLVLIGDGTATADGFAIAAAMHNTNSGPISRYMPDVIYMAGRMMDVDPVMLTEITEMTRTGHRVYPTLDAGSVELLVPVTCLGFAEKTLARCRTVARITFVTVVDRYAFLGTMKRIRATGRYRSANIAFMGFLCKFVQLMATLIGRGHQVLVRHWSTMAGMNVHRHRWSGSSRNIHVDASRLRDRCRVLCSNAFDRSELRNLMLHSSMTVQQQVEYIVAMLSNVNMLYYKNRENHVVAMLFY